MLQFMGSQRGRHTSATELIVLKNIRVMKIKERLKNSFRLNGSKPQNVVCNSGCLGYNEYGWDN